MAETRNFNFNSLLGYCTSVEKKMDRFDFERNGDFDSKEKNNVAQNLVKYAGIRK